jgi:hypothetical protein
VLPDIKISLMPDRIEAFCRKWRIVELSLFGSVLRDDFGPDSDVDVLITFEPGAAWTLWDLVQAEQELAGLTGRPVDLIERQTVEKSGNWVRRRNILSSARTIYAR